ncbi:MAG: L-lactate dehydrogenase [Anaerolineales bacterium]
MKIGIIGSGLVGSTAAYAMLMRGVGREIVLVDLDTERARAEADDILHAAPFAHALNVHAGSYSDLADCQVVIISAGVSQRPGESRLELLQRNAKVFQQVIPSVLENAPQTILLVASNPVDVMTHLSARYAAQFGVPSSRVIGSGTTLDTARFRSLLGRQLGIDPQHVHAYVIGEHGDSEVLNWSSVTVAGIPLEDFCRMRSLSVCDEDWDTIEHQVRNAAYHIIEAKGATYYGIGSALARIVEVILRDQRAILTVCSPLPDVVGVKDVTISLPSLVSGEGILATFPPAMDEKERSELEHSASLLKDIIQQIE